MSLLYIPISPFALTVIGLNWSKDRDGREVFYCRIGRSFCPFLTARQAPMFHVKRLWIYVVYCSHLSSVNHLRAGHSGNIPRPMDDPQGKVNGNQPSLTLLRYFVGTREKEMGVGVGGQK